MVNLLTTAGHWKRKYRKRHTRWQKISDAMEGKH